jgi:hypothetical protein
MVGSLRGCNIGAHRCAPMFHRCSCKWTLCHPAAGESVGVLLRDRTDADLAGCVALARAVQEQDGYPHYLPGDLRDFLVLPDAYGAWVAERDGRIVGHVALRRRTAPASRSGTATHSTSSSTWARRHPGPAGRAADQPGVSRCAPIRIVIGTFLQNWLNRWRREKLSVAFRPGFRLPYNRCSGEHRDNKVAGSLAGRATNDHFGKARGLAM